MIDVANGTLTASNYEGGKRHDLIVSRDSDGALVVALGRGARLLGSRLGPQSEQAFLSWLRGGVQTFGERGALCGGLAGVLSVVRNGRSGRFRLGKRYRTTVADFVEGA